MALKGTLKDFGIADIFQLIAQQTKTGVLHLKSKDEEVHISFHDGNVVRAEHVGRRKNDKLGAMLARAELITQPQLDEALEEQKRTLKRLGDVLVARAWISRERLREMAQLQTTETLYRLFTWKSGTYEFEQGTVEWDRDSITPLRGESVLMEGFRMVDEWPLIKKKITSYGMTFERLRPMERASASDDDLDAALDDAFGEMADKKADDELPSDKAPKDGISANERRVYSLCEAGRNVQKIIDVSRLGEFETCKSLLNLVQAGYLKPIAPAAEDKAAPRLGGDFARSIAESALTVVIRLVMSAVIVAVLFLLVYSVRLEDISLASGASGTHFDGPAVQQFLAGAQMARLRGALEVYRLEQGRYPDSLDDLVGEGLVRPDDTRHPFVERYHYRRTDEGRAFVLLPPFR